MLMKAALPGLVAHGSVAFSKSELLWEQPGLELCLQPLPPSLPQAQGWEAVCHPDSSWRSNLALDLGLCLFSICQLLALLEFRAHILAGARRCLRACGKGPPPAMTCCRWIAPVPPAKTAVVLLKNTKQVFPPDCWGFSLQNLQ